MFGRQQLFKTECDAEMIMFHMHINVRKPNVLRNTIFCLKQCLHFERTTTLKNMHPATRYSISRNKTYTSNSAHQLFGARPLKAECGHPNLTSKESDVTCSMTSTASSPPFPQRLPVWTQPRHCPTRTNASSAKHNRKSRRALAAVSYTTAAPHTRKPTGRATNGYARTSRPAQSKSGWPWQTSNVAWTPREAMFDHTFRPIPPR